MSVPSKTVRRRLDLSSTNDLNVSPNPYRATSIATDERSSVSTVVTPESRFKQVINKDDHLKPKPNAARSLITPLKDCNKSYNEDEKLGEKRKQNLYHSDDDEEMDKNLYKPTHIHANLEYFGRGNISLDQTTLKVYRFIRDHFTVPSDIESDRSFGPLSGSCFEERVIRAYSLGELEPKNDVKKDSLLVCTYCGEDGHVRDSCQHLI